MTKSNTKVLPARNSHAHSVVFHAVMIFAWMIPSFNFFISTGSINLADMVMVIIFVHVFTGIIATVLCIWLVVAWGPESGYVDLFRDKTHHARYNNNMVNSSDSWYHFVSENPSAILVSNNLFISGLFRELWLPL